MSKFKINEKKIDKLAHLAVKRGVGLQRGQNLLITAPIESLPLVRKIAEHAYKEGAHIVTPLFTDSDISLSRFKYAPEESFDNSTDWLIYLENEEVTIKYKKTDCNFSEQFDQEYIVFKITNHLDKSITINWRQELWYDNVSMQ